MRRSVFFAVGLAVSALLHVGVAAQAPHGGATARPQPGPNVNAAAGIVADPLDPAAFLKSDLLLQRQNETVVAGSTRNPDHMLAAANDYRFVDFPDDPAFGEQSFVARLIAKLFGRPARTPVPARAAASVGGWTGVYRSCDRGGHWIGGALPGGPLDNSAASIASPLKSLSDSAANGFKPGHAETTDPTLVAGPGGRMHLVVLGFVRYEDGSVGDSRLYYASYTDRNNREGGTCFTYDYSVEVDRASRYAGPKVTAPFIDKPSMAIDRDGTLYVSYTVFSDANNSTIVIARSANNGASWTRTSPILSFGFLKNHGTSTVVDPLTGQVYVAWRVFYQNWPLMVMSRSIDKGRTFLPATPISHWWPAKNLNQIVQQLKVAKLTPFDQFTSEPNTPATARALAFPSIVAGVVGGRTRLFAAWQERADVNGQPSATGSPRVMLSMSTDGGWSWTPRRALDAGWRTDNTLQTGPARPSGPQLQPALSMSGTTNPQLLVAYYEARAELQFPFEGNFVSGLGRQVDVRVARINPATGLLASPSVQVSQYAVMTNSEGLGQLAERSPGSGSGSRAVNLANLTMYGGGQKAFFGDYLSIAPSTVFESTGGGAWRWATDPSSALAIWTDSRDARFPVNAANQPDINGDWTAYTPLRPAFPAAPPPTCGGVGMRDSNPYFSEIGGIVAGSPQTFKPLTVQRAFVAYVANRTPLDRSFRLQIVDNEAGGLDASFSQSAFGAAGDIRDVTIFANSTNVQTVWVQPYLSNPTASVRVRVDEIDVPGPAGIIIPNGLKATIVLNPDPNNDALTPVPNLTPGFQGNPNANIDQTELHNPQISTPQISTFVVRAPQISSPQISTPQISTPQISTPQISTPQISTPQISTPQISTPQISTPQISTPQIATVAEGDNGTDVTYTVNNIGNTWTAYNVLFNVPNVDALLTSGNYQFQVIVTRTSLAQGFLQTAGGCVPAAVPNVQVLANIPIPQAAVPQISTIKNPQIATPQISTPQIATFALAPLGGVAGQNSGDLGVRELYGAVLPDEVKITLRAIRLRPMAAGGPTFQPAEVVAKLESQSTNVIAGAVQPPGSQPTVVDASGGAFVTQPSNGSANAAMVPPVRVLARDTTGAVVPGALITLTLSSNPTGAVLSGNTAVTGVDGIAAFPSLQVDRAGTGFVLRATTGAFVIGYSVPFSITAAAPATYMVVNENDSGPGSLRQAIIDANTNAPAQDWISFNMPGATPTITLTSVLPAIIDPVIIDGMTQPVFGEGYGVQVRPAAPIGGSAGFHVAPGGAGSTIRGLSITGWSAEGIRLTGGGNTVTGNLIGLTWTGAAAPNGTGVFVNGSSNNTIGGSGAGDRNVISLNGGHGVEISGGPSVTNNRVVGNYIGTDRFAYGVAPNGGSGVVLNAPSTVGGIAAGLGNVISGNNQNGVEVRSGGGGSTIVGNKIGTDGGGALDLGNGMTGVLLVGSSGNAVGGTVAGSKNVISGNQDYGVLIDVTSTGNTVAGNIIGTDEAGTLDLHNGQPTGFGSDISAAGVGVQGPGNFIGLPVALGGNLISGNNHGISVSAGAGGNVIQNNRIGLNADGTGAIANRKYGIFVGAPTTIGGDVALEPSEDPLEGNVISGNGLQGVYVTGASAAGTVIRRNYIGTNVAGTAAVMNAWEGVWVRDFASASILGNVISGNGRSGILLDSNGNTVQGNRIGLDAIYDLPLGNYGGAGIRITGSNNQIGGFESANPSEINRIAYNSSGGVDIPSGTGNRIQRNLIYDNTGMGIGLGTDGVTANDATDSDSGANNLQNYPVIASATPTSFTVTLTSTPMTEFIIEFFNSPSCDGTGNGEGATFINYEGVNTGASGTVSFSTPYGAVAGYVTATATDPLGNTSEFSECKLVGVEHEAESLTARRESGSWLRQASPGVNRERVGRLGGPANRQK